MYIAHAKTETATFRAYNKGSSYEERSTPVFSCTMHYISDTEVYICNAVGTFTKNVAKLLREFLVLEGYKLLRYERYTKMREIIL